MTQTQINRRRALAVVAAVPAAAGLGVAALAVPLGEDGLTELIRRYRAEIDTLNATRGLGDEELDAWIDRADAILIEAVNKPVRTTASAIAVLSLFVDDWPLTQHYIYGDQFSALARVAVDYIASTA
jgi:hypothetical protein